MVNLQPFYDAVTLYSLDKWLPLAAALAVLMAGVCIIIMAAFPRRDHPLGVVVGLLAAALVALLPLSAMALHHANWSDWKKDLTALSQEHGIHWYFAFALSDLVLITLILAAMSSPRATAAATRFLLFIVLLLHLPLLWNFAKSFLTTAQADAGEATLSVDMARVFFGNAYITAVDFPLLIAGAFVLLVVVVAGAVPLRNRVNPLAPVALGLVLAVQAAVALAFLYLLVYFWHPVWSMKLEYVIPISASFLVGAATLGYAIRRAAPRVALLNAVYQGIVVVALIFLSVLAAGNYFGWGNWRYGAFVNAYEFYHYYIGSKYSPELGYFEMYNGTLVADSETGKKFAKSTIRNLHDGKRIESPKVLAEKDKYKALFSEERWQEFLMDIRWFKTVLVPGRFGDMINDKGYNATPVWTMLVGGILSENVSTSDDAPAIVEYPMRVLRGAATWIFGEDPWTTKQKDGKAYTEPNGMLFLALLDVFLIAIATAAVVWAFGFRAALLMLIVLGTSYVMKYSHMKGAYLRTDFTMALILGVCMLKKQHYALAGSFIAYSCLSRVFPAVFFFGMGAKLAWHAIGVVPMFFRSGFQALKSFGAPHSNRGRRFGTFVAAALPILAVLVALIVALIAAREWNLGKYSVGGYAFELIDKQVLNPIEGGEQRFNAQGMPVPRQKAVPLDIEEHVVKRIVALISIAAAGCAFLGLVILWGWWRGTVPRRYLSFFASATATVVILVGASFLYHSAVKPAHHPLNYMDKIGEEGTWKRSVGNWLSRNFDGGLTVFGEYKTKIGEHNEQISPWRVGFKYWFVGVGSKRPLWAGWVRAEKGQDFLGQAADPNSTFLSRLWGEVKGVTDATVLQSPEFAQIKDSGTLERIRYREPGQPFWKTAHDEMKDNAVITRRVIQEKEKRGIYNLIILAVLGLCFFLVPGLKDHEATTWSFVLVFFLVSATYYYFILLLVPLLFFSPYLQRPSRALGVIMLLMAAWPGYYLYSAFAWKQTFSTYYYHSVMYMIIALYMMLLGAGASFRGLRKVIRRWRYGRGARPVAA